MRQSRLQFGFIRARYRRTTTGSCRPNAIVVVVVVVVVNAYEIILNREFIIIILFLFSTVVVFNIIILKKKIKNLRDLRTGNYYKNRFAFFNRNITIPYTIHGCSRLLLQQQCQVRRNRVSTRIIKNKIT